MYKITIEDEDGNKQVVEDVLCYDYISKEYAELIAEENNYQFTQNDLKELERRLNRLEHFPDSDDFRWALSDIKQDRK